MNDARLDAPATRRNQAPILAALTPYLDGRTGDVLEIGSGTGQHVAAFAQAFPNLTWWPTDPDTRNCESIDAWRAHANTGNVQPPMELDATTDWPLGSPGLPPAGPLTAIVCINVLHIAPWAVAKGLFAGARRHLAPNGILYLYGPYKRNGAHNSEGNVAFDASLRAQNPAWGIRDTVEITALAAKTGLKLVEAIEMPANNLSLFLTCDARL